LSLAYAQKLTSTSRYDSLQAALKDTYPDYDWAFSRTHKPRGYWAETENRVGFIRSLEKKLSKYYYNTYRDYLIDIQQLDDWYNVTKQLVTDNGGHGFLRK
jgi:hypothetical protein